MFQAAHSKGKSAALAAQESNRLMIDGPSLVRILAECGVTHVVWLPDSEVGTWENALSASRDVHLIRVCREGEAMAVAAGLLIGGKKPVVIIQCTGLFEAGDALRNVVHDLKLPLFLIVGVRSYLAYQRKATVDTCPVFTEPILKAWQIPYVWLNPDATASDIGTAYQRALTDNRAGAVLIPE
jgi:sulfopyruvate decarboxylase TPP-binding subunit